MSLASPQAMARGPAIPASARRSDGFPSPPKPVHDRIDRFDIGLRVAGGRRRDDRIFDVALGFARQGPVHRRIVIFELTPGVALSLAERERRVVEVAAGHPRYIRV